MPVTKSQERRFIEQNCRECKGGLCDFPLEWKEGCMKWRNFIQANERKKGK